MTLKLIHPKLGVCAEEIVIGESDKRKMIFKWKHRYGRKFYECEVEYSKGTRADIKKRFERPAAIYSNKNHEEAA